MSDAAPLHPARTRIAHIDGLRGVAILIVLVSHYFGSTYRDVLPYGGRYAHLTFLDHGIAGVALFFIISGFVIFMTLEKCKGIAEFIGKRWQRLFPAMALSSALIWLAFMLLRSDVPGYTDAPQNILPGVTFIHPAFWHAALHREFQSLDGVFWSLYVEVAFYVVVAPLYYWLGQGRAIAALILIWAGVMVAPYLLAPLAPSPVSRLAEPFYWAGFQYFSWFVSGALFYRAAQSGRMSVFLLAVMTGLLSAMTLQGGVPIDMATRAALAAMVLLFAVVQLVPGLQSLASGRALLFVGFVSYPLYLIHNVTGVGLIRWLHRDAGWPANAITALAVAAVMMAIAWLIARFGEPALQRLLKPGVVAITTRLSR